jgi:hypothetical protein
VAGWTIASASQGVDEYQPIDAAEALSLWGRPPQDVDLLA